MWLSVLVLITPRGVVRGGGGIQHVRGPCVESLRGQGRTRVQLKRRTIAKHEHSQAMTWILEREKKRPWWSNSEVVIV
jgi:hypothetical protein